MVGLLWRHQFFFSEWTAVQETYFSQFNGYYFTGDGCKRDKEKSLSWEKWYIFDQSLDWQSCRMKKIFETLLELDHWKRQHMVICKFPLGWLLLVDRANGRCDQCLWTSDWHCWGGISLGGTCQSGWSSCGWLSPRCERHEDSHFQYILFVLIVCK